MRGTYTLALVALLAADPATGQVIIQPPGADAAQHERSAERHRWQAQEALREAARRPVRGDYYGAADAWSDARQEWRGARRDERRAQHESGVYFFGR